MLNSRRCLWAAAGSMVVSVFGAVLATVLTSATPAVSAAVSGPGSGNAILGQPLDFAVQLRIDGSEALSAECISAEVGGSERRVPAAQVRTTFEVLGADLLRVRVVTQQGLDEPVISVLVHVGCQNRSTRQFVVLADPPVMPVQLPLMVQPTGALPVASPVPSSFPVALAPATSGAPAMVSAPLDARPRATATHVITLRTEPARAAAPARLAATKPTPTKLEQRRADRPAPAPPEPPSNPARGMVRTAALRLPAQPAARLKLDAAEVPVSSAEAVAVEQAIEVLTQAVSAARAAASAATVAEQRIASLEKSVLQMQAESKASRELAVQLAVQLNQADTGSRWMVPLMTVLGGLLALSAWLSWRLFARPRARREAWQAPGRPDRQESALPEPAEGREATAPIPFVTAELPALASARATPTRPAPLAPAAGSPPAAGPANVAPLSRHTASPNPSPSRLSAKPAWPPAAPANNGPAEPDDLPVQTSSSPAVFERTLPASSLSDMGAARDVSIEELIDLEQQAEFFVVLGQDDSAIDLLMEHLRSTGGGSPLPYLKLLEIYHRVGDRTAFERMRARFNQRFNAYAPEWEVGLQHGRSLEAYPGVVPRLQQVWSRPLDAMAELEALLFRKSRGDLFDLPAYREVLFLYALARDLLDRESAATGNVDLLLPLASGGEFSSTAPYAYLDHAHRSGADMADLDDRPTAPVDLDLTGAERPSSIFDPFDEKPLNSRR